MKQIVAGVLVSGLLFGGGTFADPLDLSQARTEGLAHSHTLKNANLSIKVAQLTELGQIYDFFPTPSASVGVTAPGTNLSGGWGASGQLSVTQPLWDGGKNGVLLAIDRLATQSAREAARSAYFGVLDDVDAAYFSILEAQATVAAAKSDLDAAKTALTVAQGKLEVGSTTKVDLLQAEATVAAEETTLAQDERAWAVARAKLASLTGGSPGLSVVGIDFQVYDSLVQRVASYDEVQADQLVAGVWAAAESSNPSLAQSRLAVAQAQGAADQSATAFFPTIDLGWTYTQGWGTTSSSNTLDLTATVPLNFWTTANSLESAKLAAEQSQATADETQRTLALNIETAVFDTLSEARSVVSSQKAMDYAQSNYETVLELYRLSQDSLSDLSQAEALLSTNRQALITAQYGFLTSLSTLRSYGAFPNDAAVLAVIRLT